MKLDVEGFEIAVLIGAQNCLFKHGNSKTGPGRWDRVSVDLATGIGEMRKLSTYFKISHILVHTQGGWIHSRNHALYHW